MTGARSPAPETEASGRTRPAAARRELEVAALVGAIGAVLLAGVLGASGGGALRPLGSAIGALVVCMAAALGGWRRGLAVAAASLCGVATAGALAASPAAVQAMEARLAPRIALAAPHAAAAPGAASPGISAGPDPVPGALLGVHALVAACALLAGTLLGSTLRRQSVDGSAQRRAAPPDAAGEGRGARSDGPAAAAATAPAVAAWRLSAAGLTGLQAPTRAQTEAAFERSEALLWHLFSTSPDCILLSEVDTGRLVMANAAFTRITGYTEDEGIGRTALELGMWVDPEQRDRLVQAMRVDGAAADIPARIRSRTGAITSLRLSAARFRMGGRDYMVVNARDVTATERTRLEHAAILERASIGIAFTRELRLIQANPRFEDIFGWSRGSAAGHMVADLVVDHEASAEVERLARPLLARGQPFQTERQVRLADGRSIWVRLVAQVVDPDHPIEGGTIWIADDVTERRRLDRALAAARDAAEAASRAKSAFLANTSHEIRTPLHGLLGLARLVAQDGVAETDRQRYLRQILASAEGLQGILSDILDLSRIEAGKITIESIPFDVREMLHSTDLAYRALAEAKGLALELVIGPQVPGTVSGDPLRVRQILGNYLGNAIKFTDEGRVRVEAARPRPGIVRLAVTDTGPGIAAEAQQDLWLPFTQADTSTTRRHGGTGLGLSISRELAALMGGSVGFESRPGAGSTFWVELPLADATAAGTQLAFDDAELARLRGRRVLLVEDNPVNMMIGTATLEAWGVVVAPAHDGRSAIEAVDAATAAGAPFHAVLMDVQMPGMSGREAALHLRTRHDPATLPIIALTAAALAHEREQALAAGMNDFLTKPIDGPRLRESLLRWLPRLEA